MPTTRASRGWHQVLGTEQKLQVESAERGLKENAKWKQEAYASCSRGNEKSKWRAEWGDMFLKADLLFLELKICCLNCHHYATLFVLLQQFKLLGCILLTRGPAGEAGQERGQRFTVIQGCLGPWVTSFKFKHLDKGFLGQSSGRSCCRSGISLLSAQWILHWAHVASKGYVLHKICYFFPIHTLESGFSFEKWTLRKRRGH